MEQTRIQTPRGAWVNVMMHRPNTGQNLPVLLIAPGQSCNSAGPIFETLGRVGEANGLAVIRFEWNYCELAPELRGPSAELKNEIEDYQTVFDFVAQLSDLDHSKVIVAGKSLGSIVSYQLFQNNQAKVRGLALLTPIFTYTKDDLGTPLPTPEKMGDVYYPKMKDLSLPIFMSMGKSDDFCLQDVLSSYLEDAPSNIVTSVVDGDHGLRVLDSSGKVDEAATRQNIDRMADSFFKWAKSIL